ncbi:MAG: 50S ribosomal protein L31e [Candidatus Nanoarchaeia archaeon]|nr:50S ribosomal protein L31e [Candidatus Nanoarchaeia archaeon]
MVDEKERIHVIPLRRAFLKAPIYRRTRRAVNEIRIFISRHMKVNDVRIGSKLNELLWKQGNENPPSKVKVKTRKVGDYAQVELENAPFFEQKEKTEGKSVKDKLLNTKDEGNKKEEKMVNEGKAKEIISKETKSGPQPERKEELKSKQMEAKIERTSRISKTQKSMIKHQSPKHTETKVGH